MRAARLLPSTGGDSVYLENVPPVIQDDWQCGAASLESVFRYWKDESSARSVRDSFSKFQARGVLNFMLERFAHERGFWTEIVEGGEATLKEWVGKGIPAIVMLDTGLLWLERYHFAVVRGYDERRQVFFLNSGVAEVQEAEFGAFSRRWLKAGRWGLIACPPERVDWPLAAEESAALALLLEKKGNAEAAERRYRETLAKQADAVVVRFNLANLWLKTGRLKEAEEAYRSLLEQKPAWAEAANNLAWAYLSEGRLSEALTVIENALREGAERRFDLLDTLGSVLCRLKQCEKGREILTEALANVPSGDAAGRETIELHLKTCC